VSEGDVVIGNVIEEVDLIFRKEKRGSNGVDRSITPAFVKESSVLIKRFEIVSICLTAQPVQVANLEVGPLKIVNECRWNKAYNLTI
jgi:hypothetical protein